MSKTGYVIEINGKKDSRVFSGLNGWRQAERAIDDRRKDRYYPTVTSYRILFVNEKGVYSEVSRWPGV